MGYGCLPFQYRSSEKPYANITHTHTPKINTQGISISFSFPDRVPILKKAEKRKTTNFISIKSIIIFNFMPNNHFEAKESAPFYGGDEDDVDGVKWYAAHGWRRILKKIHTYVYVLFFHPLCHKKKLNKIHPNPMNYHIIWYIAGYVYFQGTIFFLCLAQVIAKDLRALLSRSLHLSTIQKRTLLQLVLGASGRNTLLAILMAGHYYNNKKSGGLFVQIIPTPSST
jgi:hypothetical protein